MTHTRFSSHSSRNCWNFWDISSWALPTALRIFPRTAEGKHTGAHVSAHASTHAGRNYSHSAAYCRRVAVPNGRRCIYNAKGKDPSLISPLRDKNNLKKTNHYRNLRSPPMYSNSPSVPDWKTDRWDGDACGGEDNAQSDSHEPWCQRIRQRSQGKQDGALQQRSLHTAQLLGARLSVHARNLETAALFGRFCQRLSCTLST